MGRWTWWWRRWRKRTKSALSAGVGSYRLTGMTVRLTHGKVSDLVHRSINALQGSYALTGVATAFRKALKLLLTDKIPYVLSGQPATLSKKPPIWSSTPSFSITEDPSGPTALPVSVPDGGSPTITVTWLATSTPSTKPSWITFQAGNPPTITFDGNQTDGEDINASMNLRATANAQTADRSGGSITISGLSSGVVINTHPASTINVARGTTVFVANAYRVGGGAVTAAFVFASTNAPRSIPDLTISYSANGSTWDIYVTASISAALTTYDDFGLEIY